MTKINKILTDPNKGISRTSGPAGVLSRLFRKMMKDLDISPLRFHSLMQDYIHDVKNGVPNNKRDQTSMRGNLLKELEREQMTWKVFCKALRFLQIIDIDVIVRARHMNGSTTQHSLLVEIGTREEIGSFARLLNQEEPEEDKGEYVQPLDYLPVEDNNWYIWNPITQVLYEDLGMVDLPPYVKPETNARVKATLDKWRKLDPAVFVSIGMRIAGYAKHLYQPEHHEAAAQPIDSVVVQGDSHEQ